jgi:hypothetical protein
MIPALLDRLPSGRRISCQERNGKTKKNSILNASPKSPDSVSRWSRRAVMKGNEAARKPWYRDGWIRGLGILLALSVLAYLAAYLYIQHLFYRPVEVTRGPWQALDPGKPVEPLEFEVVEKGTGPVVEPGDLVQFSLRVWSARQKRMEDDGDWWVWIGFQTDKETPFHSINPSLLSAFVGLREGGE